jgi:5'-nucleotidase
MEEDPEIAEIVHGFSDQIAKSMDVVLGVTKADLDARFSEVRTKETNVSNFLASVLARATGADIALFNAGSIRADRIIPKGILKVQDLCDLLPAADPVTVIALTGEKLVAALENGVSQYPAMEGRFPCVDGVRFRFDPTQPPGSRVVPGSVLVRNRVLHPDISKLIKRRGEERTSQPGDGGGIRVQFSPLDPNKTYTLCTKSYLLAGKDGYDAFVGAPIVRDEELCPPLPTLVRNCFTEIAVLRQWEGIACPAVLKAASRFKRSVSDVDVDPFAIEPAVDGRIENTTQL